MTLTTLGLVSPWLVVVALGVYLWYLRRKSRVTEESNASLRNQLNVERKISKDRLTRVRALETKLIEVQRKENEDAKKLAADPTVDLAALLRGD